MPIAGGPRKPDLRILPSRSDDASKSSRRFPAPLPREVSEAVSAAVAAALEPFFRSDSKVPPEKPLPPPDAEIRDVVESLSAKVADLELRNAELTGRLEALERWNRRNGQWPKPPETKIKKAAPEKKVPKVPPKVAPEKKVATPKARPPKMPVKTALKTPAKEDPEALSNQQGSLTEFGLRKWCLEGYTDPSTGNRIFWKDLLLSFFFSREGFWDRIKQYSQSLTEADISVIGGKMPEDKGSFRFKLRNAGIEKSNPKNLCLWLGALNTNRAELCDDLGFLSGKGLTQWCHEGYVDPETNARVYGKDVLIRAYASSDFWNALKTYSLGLSENAVAAMGGKFPHFQAPLAERMGKEKKSVQMEELFAWFGIEIPAEARTTTLKWYLSTEGLMQWCHEGYVDVETGERRYGKDVLLRAYFSSNFYKKFGEYVKSLTDDQIKAIGGKISASPGTYGLKMAQTAESEKNYVMPKNLCLWFGALDTTMAEFSDDVWILSKKGLKRWYSEWYVAKDGTRVLGRECLERFEKSQNFWEAFREYVATLEYEDFVSMGGRFPIEPKWIASRICGKDSIRISELLEFFGVPALSAKERLKVQSSIRQMRDFLSSDEKWENTEEVPVFEIRQDSEKITIFCPDPRVRERLLPVRNYVDETILSVASEGLERFITFDWNVH